MRFCSHAPVERACFGFAFLVCLFFVLGFSLPARANDPLSSVALAQRGIDESDSDLFNRAVDVDSVLTKASGTLNTALRERLADGRLSGGAGAMVMLLSSSADDSGEAGLVKQLIVSEVKDFLAAGINGGYFAGKPNGSVKPSRGTLASTLPKISRGRKQLIPGKVLSQEENSAVVSATFADAKAGRFPLTLALERQNGAWRITEITNAAELLEKAGKRGR